MALLRSPWLFSALATAGASLAFILPSGVAHAQVVYAPYPPPPPPPPPGYYAPPPRYGVVYREGPEPFSALALGLDLEGAVPVNVPQLADGNNLSGGDGIKFRIGDQMRLTRHFRFTPEVGYGYDHLFATDNFGNAYSWDMNRIFAGIRLAFGHFLVPSVYGHIGYGWRTTGDPTVQAANGVAVDLGGALDIRLFRALQFGVHAEWVSIDAQPYAPEWVAMGGHVDIAVW